MAEESKSSEAQRPLQVAPSPHLYSGELTTRKMMIDVLLGLAPVVFTAVVVFRLYAVKQIAICVVSAVAAEAIFVGMRKRRPTLGDLSAVVTGLILALSLPGTAPWYVGAIGSFAAIGLGKVVFGGLGMNLFNPAMVGRAFVMMSFTLALAAPQYVSHAAGVPDALTQATPMTEAYEGGNVSDGLLLRLLLGLTNGSLGETSAIACLIGGIYLCVRRTAAWQIPAGMIGTAALLAGIGNLLHPHAQWTVLHHLCGGALLFGAFFIATDPVTSPLTPKGRWIYGIGLGTVVMLLRSLSAYPEGVMFAVLLMNAVVPLINRWTIPRPVGGPVPERT